MLCISGWHQEAATRWITSSRGNTNAEVLEAMEHDPALLLERLRIASESAIQRGDLRLSEARRLMDHLETSLRQSTYLQE